MAINRVYSLDSMRNDERLDIGGSLFFISVHLVALGVLLTSRWTVLAFMVCLGSYFIRMFAITGGYHRYFSHRSYKTSRLFQFFMGFLGASSAQMGPLWWAAHHRHHHHYSDTEEDVHSPIRRNIWWAHSGWILCKRYVPTRFELVTDLAKYSELRWLNKFHMVPAVVYCVVLFLIGWFLESHHPHFNTSALHMVGWGFFVSSVLLYHGTFTINSLAHRFGTRPYAIDDDSRNNLWLALITLGEGWHNNHHRYPHSERQGFVWWQIDITHWILVALSKLRIVWDLKSPPQSVIDEGRQRDDLRLAA